MTQPSFSVPHGPSPSLVAPHGVPEACPHPGPPHSQMTLQHKDGVSQNFWVPSPYAGTPGPTPPTHRAPAAPFEGCPSTPPPTHITPALQCCQLGFMKDDVISPYLEGLKCR